MMVLSRKKRRNINVQCVGTVSCMMIRDLEWERRHGLEMTKACDMFSGWKLDRHLSQWKCHRPGMYSFHTEASLLQAVCRST